MEKLKYTDMTSFSSMFLSPLPNTQLAVISPGNLPRLPAGDNLHRIAPAGNAVYTHDPVVHNLHLSEILTREILRFVIFSPEKFATLTRPYASKKKY